MTTSLKTNLGRGASREAAQATFAAGIQVSLQRVTPDLAAEWLERVHPAARRRNDAIEAYGRAMREGCWVLNGVPVVRASSGLLIDGVQRLHACVETAIPLRTMLAEHVDSDVFHTIDQHRRRSLASLLKQRGLAHHLPLANLLVRLAQYDECVLASGVSGSTSWVRLWRALRGDPAITEALADSLSRLGNPLPEPVRSMLVAMGQQVDPVLTKRLLDALEQHDRYPSDEPAVLLFDEIERSGEEARTAAGLYRLSALAIKAWNSMQQGARPRRLVWQPAGSDGRHGEPFPRLMGYRGLDAFDGGVPPRREDEDCDWQIEEIDAAVAARYLSQHVSARPPVTTVVEALALDMRQGRWRDNAQPICFTASGRLADGQHRLLAVIAAQARIRLLVIRGLGDDACASYDMQPRRPAVAATPEDPETKFGDQPLATAMANLLWRFERKAPSGTRYKRASATEIREILQQHPRLIELRSYARRMVEHGRSSVMGYGAYVIERENPSLGGIFLDALATGTDLAAGHPVLATRTALQRLRREGASQEEQLAALLAGWRRYKVHRVAEEDLWRLRTPKP
jgi:hypothetical protein